MKEIKIFRLVSTEQILGFLLEEKKDSLIIEYPLEIIIEYFGEADKHELSAIKWSPFSDDITTEIDKSLILSSSLPKKELLDFYKLKINKLYLDKNNTSLDDEDSDYYSSVLDSFDDDTEH
jgi:hypothetical protein